MHFEKASKAHQATIFDWLNEPHVMAFWDNSQAHKDDILNFMEGRQTPSSYANGGYVYWIVSDSHRPFALIMSIQETEHSPINAVKLSFISKTGNTYSLDYMIGDKNYVGKGLGACTLAAFIDFFRSDVDPQADTFMIDPAVNNPRAIRVYLKAGFEHVDDFIMQGPVSSAGEPCHLLVKKF